MNKITLASIVLLAFACGRNPGDPDQHDDPGHQHSEDASQYTLFGDNTEFFVEHQPLVAGVESEFLVHVTWLDTYEPCAQGSVTIRIDGDSATSDQPHLPGIFEVPFVPGNAGVFDLDITLVSGEATETVTGHAHVYKDHDEIHLAAESGHSHGAGQEGEISFLKEQAWKSEFLVSRVKTEMISMVISTSGELISPPGKIKRVQANIGGIISFADKNLVQGSHVNRGQHLFTISGKSLPEYNFQLQLLQSANSLEQSRSEYVRHRILYKQGAVSERQLQESKSAYTADSLHYDNLAAFTSEEGLKVYAQETGTIHELEVAEGDYVETGQGLVTISSDKILLLRADLPQQYHGIADKIHTANFRTAYSRDTHPIEFFNGRHLATGHSVAENDHYLPVYFELENNGSLLEGAFAEIYLKGDSESERIAIPLNALMEDQGSHYVYVQVTGETYTKRLVSTGVNDGRIIEITAGLDSGERIVSQGVVLIKAASAVTGVVGDGHSH